MCLLNNVFLSDSRRTSLIYFLVFLFMLKSIVYETTPVDQNGFEVAT